MRRHWAQGVGAREITGTLVAPDRSVAKAGSFLDFPETYEFHGVTPLLVPCHPNQRIFAPCHPAKKRIRRIVAKNFMLLPDFRDPGAF